MSTNFYRRGGGVVECTDVLALQQSLRFLRRVAIMSGRTLQEALAAEAGLCVSADEEVEWDHLVL